MTKKEAYQIFGGAQALAKALGITHQAVYAWPDTLPQRLADEVIGAAIRLGLVACRDIATTAPKAA